MSSSPSVTSPPSGTKPARSGLVLAALILAAGVANMNLTIANVALPDIGIQLHASQAGLNLVSVGFELGLSISVLYLGALGDRYGRKGMLILGLALGLPTAALAAASGSVEMLMIARVCGGIAAGMAYPTTLALITALWSGPPRTRAIALWSALGAGMSALSPMLAGALLMVLPWGWAFIIPVPFGIVALALVIRTVPSKVNQGTEPVDHAGGILSAIFFGGVVIAINFAELDTASPVLYVSASLALIGGVAFFWRQHKAANPLFNLKFARRPTFWVATVAGIIVFGSLMGYMYVGMQYMQNVLLYPTFLAGLAILPCPVFMVLVAPYSSKMVLRWGSRVTLLAGFVACILGFLVMLFVWGIDSSYLSIGIAYALVGVGVGLAGTPSSHALTDSVPVSQVGMASGTGDLQRDLGSAIMQSVMGAILGAGYASAVSTHIAGAPANIQNEISSGIRQSLSKSFGSAVDLAKQYPQYQDGIVQAAKESFLAGANWAYLGGVIASVIGILLVWFFFPRRDRERRLYTEYGSE